MSVFFCNFATGKCSRSREGRILGLLEQALLGKEMVMKEPQRILFLSQEIYPYLEEQNELRMLNRQLPQSCQENGMETRTFMPKFGEINERRNQLHEVIRLSGLNIVINDADHPTLLKVASIQQARIQIYFIDNDEYFNRRKGVTDAAGKEYADNDERSVFYTRASLETVHKLRWSPNLIYCSGWMSAIAALYIKKAYADSPFFGGAKIVVALDDNRFKGSFPAKFARKALIRGLKTADVEDILDKPVTYNALMKLAINNADAVVINSADTSKTLIKYAKDAEKPILPYQSGNTNAYVEFFKEIMG